MKKKKTTPESGEVLVYSTDWNEPTRCHRCAKEAEHCACSLETLLAGVNFDVRLEKKGRAGKSVTRIGRLPCHERLLKELAAYLKKSLACGGTYYLETGQGVVEIQGERREQILGLINKLSCG